MAAKKGGFDCEFVKKPQRAFQSKCSVCKKILCEPYQVSCCGNSFCKACIKRNKMACPTCEEKGIKIFHNKGLQCSLYGLEVYCSHKQEGCEWKGELGQLDNHLNLSPQPDKQLEGCEYSEIECIYCSELIKRSNITSHQIEHCDNRPFSCEYCHSYESTYEDVINNHWLVCAYHPVRCPNECGTFHQRQALENHVTKDCPETVIDCVFHHVGCNVKLPRKDMPAHLNENLVTHMSLQAASYKQLQEKVQQMEQEIATLKQTSQVESEIVKQIVKSTKLRLYNAVTITMHNYQQHKRENNMWYSPAFYTHPQGYRLCIRVNANGFRSGLGTHISVFVYLMKGEFDDLLSWPFQGDVAIKIDGMGYEEKIRFRSSTPNNYNSRVTEGDRSRNGFGVSKFVSHTTLELHYVDNDSLNFHIRYTKATLNLIPV